MHIGIFVCFHIFVLVNQLEKYVFDSEIMAFFFLLKWFLFCKMMPNSKNSSEYFKWFYFVKIKSWKI